MWCMLIWISAVREEIEKVGRCLTGGRAGLLYVRDGLKFLGKFYVVYV